MPDTPKTQALLSDEETKQRLYDLFGQNFLDGDEPDDWRASRICATEVKEYIDEYVLALIKQQQQAYGEWLIGEVRPYKKYELCPRCSNSQYACTCHDAEESQLDELRAKNNKGGE